MEWVIGGLIVRKADIETYYGKFYFSWREIVLPHTTNGVEIPITIERHLIFN
jgi:hypothetical protein